MPSPYNIVQGLVSGPVFKLPWWDVPALYVSTPSAKGRDIATWAYAGNYFVPTNGGITGTVAENSTPLANCDVLIYFRENGFLIAKTKTDASGTFSFGALDPTPVSDPDNGRYFIVALDPAGGVRYNAIIYDRILAT